MCPPLESQWTFMTEYGAHQTVQLLRSQNGLALFTLLSGCTLRAAAAMLGGSSSSLWRSPCESNPQAGRSSQAAV